MRVRLQSILLVLTLLPLTSLKAEQGLANCWGGYAQCLREGVLSGSDNSQACMAARTQCLQPYEPEAVVVVGEDPAPSLQPLPQPPTPEYAAPVPPIPSRQYIHDLQQFRREGLKELRQSQRAYRKEVRQEQRAERQQARRYGTIPPPGYPAPYRY